jgi:hypothetical protein
MKFVIFHGLLLKNLQPGFKLICIRYLFESMMRTHPPERKISSGFWVLVMTDAQAEKIEKDSKEDSMSFYP